MENDGSYDDAFVMIEGCRCCGLQTRLSIVFPTRKERVWVTMSGTDKVVELIEALGDRVALVAAAEKWHEQESGRDIERQVSDIFGEVPRGEDHI